MNQRSPLSKSGRDSRLPYTLILVQRGCTMGSRRLSSPPSGVDPPSTLASGRPTWGQVCGGSERNRTSVYPLSADCATIVLQNHWLVVHVARVLLPAGQRGGGCASTQRQLGLPGRTRTSFPENRSLRPVSSRRIECLLCVGGCRSDPCNALPRQLEQHGIVGINEA